MGHRGRSALSGLAAVLAVAAVAFVVRGALQSDQRPPGAGLPAFHRDTVTNYYASKAGQNVAPSHSSIVATSRKAKVWVYAHPAQAEKGRRLIKQRVFNRQRIPLTFLVQSRRKGWVHVNLPTRPNRSKGWVHRTDVDFAFTRYEVVISLKHHRLALREGGRTVLRRPIGVGKALSPTPKGTYFVTDVVRTKDPKGFYGPYALGLSAHSPVYTTFEGGDGQVGIHGTSEPQAIGSDVSHGCIRVRNDVISLLAHRVPLGTPVDIRA